MGNKLKIRKSFIQGFTIVETVIVLAIAMLILTIILIAVPDLQREARNHEKYQEALRLVADMNEYYSLNGHMPDGFCTNGPDQPVYFDNNAVTDIQVEFTPGYFRSTDNNIGTESVAGDSCTSVDIGGTQNGYIHFIPIATGGVITPKTFPRPNPVNDNQDDHIVINIGTTCVGGIASNQNSSTAKFADFAALPTSFSIDILYEDGDDTYTVKCYDG